MPVKRVLARGPRDAKIMIVGDMPTLAEEKEGIMFTGSMGYLLDSALSSVGIRPEHVYYTSLVKHRTGGGRVRGLVDGAGMPTEDLMNGLMELKEEIAEIRPNVIIPLGTYPLKFLTGKGSWKKQAKSGGYDYTGIDSYRGSILEGNGLTGGAKCIATYAPATVQRAYSLKHIMRADLARAFAQSKYPEIRRPSKHIVIDPQGVERRAWLDWLKAPAGTLSPSGHAADSYLSGDIEYIGSRLLCLGATRNRDVSVVLRTDTLAAVREVKDLLLSGVPLCFQNGMFDCSILEWFFDIPCIKYLKHDTMVAMHVSYTEFPKDLGFIGSIFTEQPVWWDKIDWNKIKKGQQPITDVLEYNAIDVWVTHESMECMLADELTDKELMDEYEYEMSLIRPLWEVSKRGMKVDKPRMDALKTRLETEAQLYLQGLRELAGKAFNPRSGGDVSSLLYDKLGLKRTGAKTKAGKDKADDQTLADLLPKCVTKEQIAAVKMIRRCRTAMSLISKFCNIELDDDGRMRCHYDPAKTDTSRLSSRKFYPTKRGANLQNIPKTPMVRSVFVADKGMFFGYADLKSAESMVVAHRTGDREMLRLHSPEYMDGTKDGHKFVAAYLLDKPIEEVNKDDRYIGKQCRHALNYMMGWHTLMKRINKSAEVTGVLITAAQAKVYVAKYQQLHPMLKPWWDEIAEEVRTTHTVRTLLGRKRVFYGRPEEVLPNAIAYQPQGTIAKALNLGLLKCAADYELNHAGYQLLCQVHDAVGFQAPIENLDFVSARIAKLLEIPIPIRRRSTEPYEIIVPVDVQVGLNWGEFDPKKPDMNPNGLREWTHGMEASFLRG